MRHTASTAPRGARPPAAALLAAVVLALLAALGTVAGPAAGATGGTAVGAPALDHPRDADHLRDADHPRDTVPRADDGRDIASVLHAATRPETHREHPAPRCDLTACGAQDTDATPPASAQSSPSGGHLPPSQPPAYDDRGRAPPAPSGS